MPVPALRNTAPLQGRTPTVRQPLATGLTAVFVTALAATGAAAQAPATTIQLPPVTVTAQKEPANPATLPVSVTAVSKSTLVDAGANTVSEAAQYSPNTFFTEFAARKLSNARFRGIGSSPGNPGVTTYFDGVPQFNANTSSIDLLDVDQVEFVRGPQSALFGRNALGGLINVVSARPSLSTWTGSFSAPVANAGSREIRASAGGPVVSGRAGASFSLIYGQRDGYTTNAATGNDLDKRESFSAKGQLLWTPVSNWETRLIVNGERARDGDYALNDLGALRARPFTANRDFEGSTHRDVFGTTILNRREGGSLAFTTTTGFLSWKTEDATDLDYTPLPLLRRNNAEEAFQFTQEVRVASAANAPMRLSDSVALRWQAGVFFFTQNYDQDAVNTFAPFVLSPFVPLTVSQQSPLSSLDDKGIGLFGQATAVLRDKLDVTGGLRFDHEQKEGILTTSFAPQIAPPIIVSDEKGFSNLSPQVSVAFRPNTRFTVYGATSRGFKAGGFNPASPSGSELYGEELTWHAEGGVKATLMEGRVALSAAVFNIDWHDLQLNRPDPFVPGQFYIANVGGASSRGVEFEAQARVATMVDVFGSLGYTRARFDDDSASSGVPVGGNDIPNTPKATASIGTQISRPVTSAIDVYGRAEVTAYGSFKYDDLNIEGQDAYALTNLRVGARGRHLFAEGWIRNAFDTRYIPVAFAYGALAPSGYIGEMGRPRTFGLNVGVTF
jgi:iron complex outermembrane receptor protein